MKLIPSITALGCCLFLSGCSVIMAASESESVDLAKVQAGATRAEVEEVLTNRIEEGGSFAARTVVYQYFSNDERSYGRAAAYGLLDIATVGFAELATTPIEALQGNKHLVTVTYDIKGRVMKVTESVETAPLEKPERILGIEKDEPHVVPAVLTPPTPELPGTTRASM